MNPISSYSKGLNYFVLLAAILSLGSAWSGRSAAIGKTFPSPDDAVRALSKAVKNFDSNALAAIFGPAYAEITPSDPVEAQNEIVDFAERLDASNHIDHAENGRYILEVGQDRWPFAIPIVQKGATWFFDTEAGKEELINRRIGRNELDALKSMRAYVDAQRNYAREDHSGNEVLKYAQRIISTPGTRDGLYWPPGPDGEESPLGPLIAEAQTHGYLKGLSQKEKENENEPRPFHGYLFRILTQQGSHAPGGAYNYIINGNMIGGFALIAWPADYGDSGIMTFIINQRGKVYQKDLGPDTESVLKRIMAYDPDPSWTVAKD